MKRKLLAGLFILSTLTALPQKVTVVSPNQKISIALYNQQNQDVGEWYLKVSYISNGNNCEAIPRINLGLSRIDQDFSKELKFLKAGKPLMVTEPVSYTHLR